VAIQVNGSSVLVRIRGEAITGIGEKPRKVSVERIHPKSMYENAAWGGVWIGGGELVKG